MQLSLQQAAERLGKSVRQVRYLIKQEQLPATKVGNKWRIDSDHLPRTPGQEAARERKQSQLKEAVEDALSLPANPRKRYSVKDLRAFKIAAPLYRQSVEHLGNEHPVSDFLHQTLEELARGCHRFRRDDKAVAYRSARDKASQAACRLALIQDDDQSAQMLTGIEQELMAALAGLLRRLERRGRRPAPVT